MSRRPIARFLVSAALVVSPGAVLAQDAPPAPPAPPAPTAPDDAPKPPVPQAPDPEKLAERIAELHPRAMAELAPPPLDVDAEKRAEFVRAVTARDDALAAVSKATDEYVRATAGGGASARTLYLGGSAKVRRGDRIPGPEANAERAAGADLLRRAMETGPADASWRADAAFWRGFGMLFLTESGGATPLEAAGHLRDAAVGFLADKRHDDAGRAVAAALRKLLATNHDDAARDLIVAVRAETEDFGRATDPIRTLVRKAQTGAGSKFPALADCTDADGRPVVWKELAGTPFVLHFFRAGWPTGNGSGEREIETVLRPLHDRLSAKGLKMVGVSTDLALAPDAVARIRKNWEEWVVRERLWDGSRASVGEYVEKQGIRWPWIWNGLWTRDPISLALGGVGLSGPHAIVVDRAGVIRWRGDAPFQGLAEAAEEAVK